MKKFLRITLFVLIGILILGLIIPTGFRLISRVWNWGFDSVQETKECPACICENIVNPVPQVESEFNCKAAAEAIKAPPEMVRAICVPAGTGSVSDRLPVGTKVAIGTITFDAEDRVWVLQNFVTPSMANYSFEYKGAELKLFKAPFVLGSELGWADDGSRVPFRICWNTEGDCQLPAGPDGNPIELFPTN